MRKPGTLPVARPKRPPSVLICAKCVKKAEGGKAIRRALKEELSDRAKATAGRAGKLVATRCMGVCPKRAVTLASGTSLIAGELLLVEHAADVPTALERLLS